MTPTEEWTVNPEASRQAVLEELRLQAGSWICSGDLNSEQDGRTLMTIVKIMRAMEVKASLRPESSKDRDLAGIEDHTGWTDDH